MWYRHPKSKVRTTTRAMTNPGETHAQAQTHAPPIIAVPMPELTRTGNSKEAKPTFLSTANTDTLPPVVIVVPISPGRALHQHRRAPGDHRTAQQ